MDVEKIVVRVAFDAEAYLAAVLKAAEELAPQFVVVEEPES